MIVNSFPSSNANTLTPYVPLGRQPVGQENSDLKTSSLKALEQSAAVARNKNRRIPEDQTGRQTQQQPSQTDTQSEEQLAKDKIKENAFSASEQAHARHILEETNNKTIKLNRYLVEIGVVKGSSAVGNFLNNRA